MIKTFSFQSLEDYNKNLIDKKIKIIFKIKMSLPRRFYELCRNQPNIRFVLLAS